MSLNNTQNLQNSQSGSEPCKEYLLPDQTKEGVFRLDKKAGETLATFVERFRKENDIEQNTPITYAGRLDPMALGEMLVLAGEDCKRKDEFLGLDKTYEFEVLFGLKTDTFDMLGLVTNFESLFPKEQQIKILLEKIKLTTEFPYPPYSSKPVGGIPLFSHARSGTLPKEMPVVEGSVKEIVWKGFRETTLEEAIKEKIEIIKKVEGDFRQEEILKGWQDFIKEHGQEKCLIGIFEATVSSGVYIRTLATILGGVAYKIDRKKIIPL
jgi:tRNA pseudouridine(55) synthase